MKSGLTLLLALAACVELPSPPRGTDRPLRIATWNMEHLAERDGEGCRPRVEADYATGGLSTFLYVKGGVNDRFSLG